MPKYHTDQGLISKATEILILVLRILFFQNWVGGGKNIKNEILEFQYFNNLCVLYFTKFNFNL